MRSANSRPTPPATGTSAVVSATCTGAIVALTRVSTATSPGAAPAASAAATAAAVAPTGSGVADVDHPPAVSDAARITLATRRRLWRSSRSAASTTPAGQR